MADEGQHSHVTKETEVIGTRTIFLKGAEVLLSVFSVGLIVDPFDSFQQVFAKPRTRLDDVAFIYVTIGGYLIINSLFILCHLLGDRLPKKTSLLFAAIGAVFHVIAASIIVYDWRQHQGNYAYTFNNALFASKQYLDMLIAGAVFTYVNAAVFVAELVVTFRYS